MEKRAYSATQRAELAQTGEDSTPVETPAPNAERIPDFPVECLPPILAAEARAIAELLGVPLGMSGPMVLSTASMSLGRSLFVSALPGKLTRPNLYVLVCKTSGSGGSVTFNHATAPLTGMQKTLRMEFEQKIKPRIDAERDACGQQIEEAKRKLKGTTGDERGAIVDELTRHNEALAGIERRSAGQLLYVTDVTPEKLATMLTEQGETLAHIDSDAGDALGIIVGTRYGNGKHTSDSLWDKGYSGDPLVVFRQNGGKPIHLESPCLSVLFVATPDTVQELFRNPRFTSGGFLARFNACDPGARPMPLDADAGSKPHALPANVSQPYEAAIFAAVHRYRISAADDPDEIGITPEARQLFIADWNRFCATASDGANSPFEARHTENAIRIALVCHAFCHAAIKQRGPGTYGATMHAHEHPLDAQTARDALAIRDWFNVHQRAFLAPQRVAADDTAWEKAEKLMRDRSPEPGITARDLYTGHRVCRDSESAERLLAQWCEEGRIVSFERKREGAGRPTTAYRLTKCPRN